MSCYRKTNGQIESFNASSLTPCGGGSAGSAQACCSAGDTCLSNSICHYNAPSEGGSGYYVAGCTDPNYKDPMCLQACVDLPFQDVVFNFASNLWECCGNQHACGAPVSNETFQALPPTRLQTIGTANPNAAAAAASSTAAAASVAAAAAAAGPKLSTGAAIGIGAASTVAVVLIIALIVWCVMARKRRHKVARDLPTHDVNSFRGYQPSWSDGRSRGPSTVSVESRRAFLSQYPHVYHVDGGVKRELEG